MKQYRPSIDELKRRYSRMIAERRIARLREAARPPGAKQVRTPDNSEPWLPHLPKTVDECAWVSNQVAENIAAWKLTYPKIFSSAG